MNSVLEARPSTPAYRPMTEAQFADLLRESHDHIDPTTGAVLWQVTPEDVLAFDLGEFYAEAWL